MILPTRPLVLARFSGVVPEEDRDRLLTMLEDAVEADWSEDEGPVWFEAWVDEPPTGLAELGGETVVAPIDATELAETAGVVAAVENAWLAGSDPGIDAEHALGRWLVDRLCEQLDEVDRTIEAWMPGYPDDEYYAGLERSRFGASSVGSRFTGVGSLRELIGTALGQYRDLDAAAEAGRARLTELGLESTMLDDCDYLPVATPGLLGIVPAEEIDPDEPLRIVSAKRDDDGTPVLSVVVDRAPWIEAEVAWIILGPADDRKVMWTCHPGDPLPSGDFARQKERMDDPARRAEIEATLAACEAGDSLTMAEINGLFARWFDAAPRLFVKCAER